MGKTYDENQKPSNIALTCLNTHTVNSIPNCFNLDVVPFPIKFKNMKY